MVNFKKLCVLGLGYIGLPTASTFATHGIEVTGVDINEMVVSTLRGGEVHIQEPGLRTVVEAAVKSGKLSVSNRPGTADAFIIAVPTPFHHNEYGEYQGRRYMKADMRAVVSATESILPHLRNGNLVILESTSPPRTTVGLVQPILEKTGLRTGVDFHLAYSPERVLPGQILRELIENARVIGGVTPACAAAGRDLYSLFVRGEIVLTDATTAEMVKLMENTYRDVNIAIANEFSRLAQRFGVDVWEAIQIANRHPRVKILRPGPGVGGHCISVDPWFLVETAPDLAGLIYQARQVNDTQPGFTLGIIQDALGSLRGKRIAALGLAFKEDVDDLRESPAVGIARLLAGAGALVKAFEPFKPGEKFEGFETVASLQAALDGADGIVLLVGHTQFKELQPSELATRTPARVVVDTRGVLDPAAWQAAGFAIHRLGAGK
ncbi:MAG: nucleotide sugar dehydrogenase [Chloroflexi bacterium]|nr:nucleotide sugar dehydrogenase [Chloroflexota bacterium]